ncbi:D-ribose ABC transporter substrate-binding protein [Solirhodobacter olei]|uniref:D-ribose ABC transporter substrate-binding protein n=1 Tax=Solirhodobacter olei TaxID=2493082 RepID=UPI000FDA73BE|nr:D-ribose ABC transporter substrate-binding protein [Solirhodobacter olei]
MTLKTLLGTACMAASLGVLALPASAATPSVQSQKGTNGKTIAIFVPSLSNPFFVAEEKFAADEATKLGYGTMVASHDGNAETQLNLIKTAIARHVSAIVLDNAGADESISAVKTATDAGVPVFLIDREINAKGIAKAQIVSNNFQGAQLEGTQFAKLMGYKGTYVELTGLPSDTNAKVRAQGAESVLNHFKDMKMVGKQTADWSQSKGFSVMQTLLQAHPDVKGVIAGNDTMALGAEAALLAAHKPDVIVVGFDGSPDVVASIKKGQIKADVLQPIAVFSQKAVIEADQYIKTGKTGLPEKQELNCILITPENVGNYTNWAMKS